MIWLEDKIRSEEIDQIISAEISNTLTDPEQFDIVTSHIIRELCGTFTMTSPCMEDGICKKRFPLYPLYRRRRAENGGHTFIMRMSDSSNQVEIDNESVVPYLPLL